jgi:intracellular sulfur oxidation DsrE/DsrF family protein
MIVNSDDWSVSLSTSHLVTKMKDVLDSIHPRRRFLGRAAAAIAALTAGVPGIARAGTLSIDLADDPQHDAWMRPLKGKHRQIFHALDANDRAMLMASNYLDAYEHEFGAKPGEANAIIGVHGSALNIGFTDAAWAKYSIGKAANVMDPTTKEPSVRNIFATGGELTVDTLQKRGALFLMCNTALRLRSRALAKERGEPYEAVYKDLEASRLPGTILVPALVVAINRAQEKGFTYVRV